METLENGSTPLTTVEDRDLKNLLLETCAVRPGQEERAWTALRDRLNAGPVASGWSVLFQPSWRSGAFAGIAIGLMIGAMASYAFTSQSQIFATADSQAPGVYATSFYSKPAQAQVVWLNGMEPANDKPTFLEKTGQVSNAPDDASAPASDPNSL